MSKLRSTAVRVALVAAPVVYAVATMAAKTKWAGWSWVIPGS